MKIIITESQFNLLIKEGVGTELEDYNPDDDGGIMKGTKKPLGEDYFPKNLVFKILDYCKLKLSGDSEVVNFENKIKNQNKIRRDDRKKMDNYLGIIMSDCRNTNLETRENYPLMCLAVTDLIVGDSDNVFSVSYNPQWQNLKKNKSNVSIDEKWTKKYKRSINCNAPKGFSQKAHCQGRKKRLKEEFKKEERFKKTIERNVNEYASNYEWCDGIEISVRETNWLTEKQKPVYEYGIKFKDYSSVSYEEQENLFDDIMFIHTMYFPIEEDDIDCYMSVKSVYPNGDERGFPYSYNDYNEQITESEEKEDKLKRNGYDIEGIKTAIKVMSQLSETYGEGIPLDFSLHDYYLKQNEGNRRPILQLFIDIDKKDGEEYKITQMYRHEISVELLNVFEMMGLYEEERMSPYYNFHFNKRNLE